MFQRLQILKKTKKKQTKKIFFPQWTTPYPPPPLSGLSTKKRSFFAAKEAEFSWMIFHFSDLFMNVVSSVYLKGRIKIKLSYYSMTRYQIKIFKITPKKIPGGLKRKTRHDISPNSIVIDPVPPPPKKNVSLNICIFLQLL